VANAYSDEWEFEDGPEWTGGARSTRLPRGDTLGASVYELAPGTTVGLYHFHHGAEELLIVLRGRPSLRTPEGTRQLEEGDVVHFARGPAGAHQVRNDSDTSVRCILVGTFTSPESAEYPDSGQISVMARTESQAGGSLWRMFRFADGEGA
jgi:uncharacterized cupin superfamily protein